MPTKQKTVFGRIKIEKASTDIVKLNSGLVLKLRRVVGSDAVEYVEVFQGNTRLFEGNASSIVQAAKVIETVDDRKKFVCSDHGSFEARDGMRQAPECIRCHAEKMDLVYNRISNGSEQLEEADQ